MKWRLCCGTSRYLPLQTAKPRCRAWSWHSCGRIWVKRFHQWDNSDHIPWQWKMLCSGGDMCQEFRICSAKANFPRSILWISDVSWPMLTLCRQQSRPCWMTWKPWRLRKTRLLEMIWAELRTSISHNLSMDVNGFKCPSPTFSWPKLGPIIQSSFAISVQIFIIPYYPLMLHLGLAAFNLLSTQLGRLDSWLFKHSWFAIIIHFNWFHPWVLNLPAHPDLLGWASITACGMYEFPRKIGMEQTGHTLDIHGYALCSGYHKLKPGRSGRTTEFCACWGNQLFWVLTWLPNCIQLPFQSSCGTVGPTLRWQPHPWWVQRLESLLSFFINMLAPKPTLPKYHTQTISHSCHLRMNENTGHTQRFGL